jgi:hypothetical protein
MRISGFKVELQILATEKKAKNKFLVFTKTMSLMLTFKISAYSVLLIFET